MIEPPHSNSLPPKEGLYDPAYEHDACGVGFIANIEGIRSALTVQKGLEILTNLTHRGAAGSDAATGDGAGILTQIPHMLFSSFAGELGFTLPEAGKYGLGCVFLPQGKSDRNKSITMLETIIAEEGLLLLGWRDVPTDNTQIGKTAREVEPVIRQVFIEQGVNTPSDMLEWKLYVIRKRWERDIRKSGLSQRAYCYMPSLSSRVIIYKGLLHADQVSRYFLDLNNEQFESAIALVHQRYSTNTFPTWDLGQPFRYLAHNGEINTLRGNVNWMRARQHMMRSTKYGDDLQKLFPICTPGASDSANFDNALELLVLTGRSLPRAMSMLIPEPWEHHESMPDECKAYYEYQSCLMEPWDGPASIAFTDGRWIGASLDRNGLRPCRYWITKNNHVVMASEAGVLDVAPDQIKAKGRLKPGRMFLVDTKKGILVNNQDIKTQLAERKPYRKWLNERRISIDDLPSPSDSSNVKLAHSLTTLQRAFGYTLEDLKVLMAPMAASGKEAIGSMGNDTPLAILSNLPHLLFNYFKQLFAQVTNPPLDAIREKLVTSLFTSLGKEGNLLEETPKQCEMIHLEHPILTIKNFQKLVSLPAKPEQGVPHASRTFTMTYPAAEGTSGVKRAIEKLRNEVRHAIEEGVSIVILSDRDCGPDRVAIPSLLATSAVHHCLIREGTRTLCSLVIDSGEPREVHHFALLIAYGATAIHPYLAYTSLLQIQEKGYFEPGLNFESLENKYNAAVCTGLLKVMSKMGISTLQSYRGAQIFEAVGLSQEFIDEYFTRTATRIEGIGLNDVAAEALKRHDHAWPQAETAKQVYLDIGGQYAWRRKGEAHLFNPVTISSLQQSARLNSREEFQKFCNEIDDQQHQLLTLRGLLDFKWADKPVPLEDVEPAKSIVKRFATGAMSFGSISKEAHETLAIAMNSIGAKSNTGEGGEDPNRFQQDENGQLRRSAIKQVASGRFGVTSEYLVNADEIQIKMAQGAKPGEGGQLPGHKVDAAIAGIRNSTPGVGLISPPPHHDIYSIEDLAQLIHDLKNANSNARISVKLVAEVGVGTVAAGVAKAKSDNILISGYDGGTGASPLTSIKHAGAPWELGLAEAHQVLLKNNLRSRVVLQTDGQLRTARDLAIATLLGAEEWGIATAALVVTGCIMMRKCHLNTCPVGIATQDPALRKKFRGQPEHVVNFFFMLAEELRILMAKLGFRTIEEMVGHVEQLKMRDDIAPEKAGKVDLASLLQHPDVPESWGMFCSEIQDHGLDASLDKTELLEACTPALENGASIQLNLKIRNVNRTVGTILS